MSIRCTFAHVDLAALQSNFRAIESFLAADGTLHPEHQAAGPKRPGIIGVVKANAYGHGAHCCCACAAGRRCDDSRVRRYRGGVSSSGRQAFAAEILIFGALSVSDLDGVFDYTLLPTISTPGAGRSLQAAAARHRVKLACHLKVDTGMNRLGLRFDNLEQTLPELIASPNLEITSVYTHFATADDPDCPLFQVQRERFERVLDRLPHLGIRPRLRHAANSAATLRDARVWYDLVRPGLMMYGVVPPPLASTIPLKPVLSLRSRVVAVKGVRAGETVGYGASWAVPGPGRIAVVPAGYADGLDRRMAGSSSVLIRGRRAPVVGAVNMDMITVDVSDVQVETGDEVVIIGEQGDDRIDVREIAAAIGTNPYEVLCRVGTRIERIYQD